MSVTSERGFSILQLLITLMIITVISALGVMGIVQTQQSLRLSNSTREFLAYMERARLDSIRRHAQPASATMASVTVNATSYSVAIDFDGDGTANTRVMPLPNGITFSGDVPATISFNWRGRPVNADGSPLTPPALTLSNSRGEMSVLSISGAGDSGVGSGYGSTLTVGSVSAPASTAVSANANIRKGTMIDQAAYPTH
jgi:type II secretory pathway pseudopilin PulG